VWSRSKSSPKHNSGLKLHPINLHCLLSPAIIYVFINL
jgi:hypothetical protein